jgi:hypothetical protein
MWIESSSRADAVGVTCHSDRPSSIEDILEFGLVMVSKPEEGQPGRWHSVDDVVQTTVFFKADQKSLHIDQNPCE